MTFNSAAPLAKLATLLSGLAGVSSVFVGPPKDPGVGVSAYVGLGGQTVEPLSFGKYHRYARYFIGLCYRVDGAPATAEGAVAVLVDKLIAAVLADTTLGGTCFDATLDLSLADAPRYQLITQQEYRVYPLTVVAEQDSG